MTATETIEATLNIVIEHIGPGPEISDPQHVIAWTCADGAWIGAGRNGFTFEVCPIHADPDECTCETVTFYRASIVSADLDSADVVTQS